MKASDFKSNCRNLRTILSMLPGTSMWKLQIPMRVVPGWTLSPKLPDLLWKTWPQPVWEGSSRTGYSGGVVGLCVVELGLRVVVRCSSARIKTNHAQMLKLAINATSGQCSIQTKRATPMIRKWTDERLNCMCCSMSDAACSSARFETNHAEMLKPMINATS